MNPSRSFVRRGEPVDAEIVFPSNQGWDDIGRAQEELQRFVRVFLKHLADKDGPNSSLQVFCRVDVGIFVKSPNVVSYFVNEVERGITTSLWVGDGSRAAGIVGTGVVPPLKRWIAAEKIRLDVRKYHTG